jgi:uncharacterized protein
MPSDYETFFELQRYAVVGHSQSRRFPCWTYGGLKDRGKTVYPVDPSVSDIAGDRAYPDLASVPGPVDAVVIEVPRAETRAWVEQVVGLGVKDLWLHMNTDSPEALALARDAGIRVRSGTCAVMYLRQGFTYHSIHRYLAKAFGKY